MTSSNKETEHVKVLVKVKRPKRFKAGAELSSAVNLNVEEDVNDETENLQIQLTIEHSFDADRHCKTD
jgi:hypothetical protein